MNMPITILNVVSGIKHTSRARVLEKILYAADEPLTALRAALTTDLPLLSKVLGYTVLRDLHYMVCNYYRTM